MADEKPTAPEGGASIESRIENYLAAEEGKEAGPEPSAPAEKETPEANQVEEPADGEQEQEEGPQLSISDVAKILGVDESVLDVDEDGALKVRTKIDGAEGVAKFNELLKSYQLQGHVDAKAREAAEFQKQLHAERVQLESIAQAKAQELWHMANVAQQILMQDAARIDWDSLAQNDPVEYVAKKHQFDARSQQVQQFMGAAGQQVQQIQQYAQQRAMQALEAEERRLPTLIPEWSDMSVRAREKGAIAEWLKGRGASQAAINSLTDASLVAALRVAMLAEKTTSKTADVEKKVRSAPKLVKPGQSVDARQRAGETVRGLKEQIRKSGGKAGIAEYLIAAGKV